MDNIENTAKPIDHDTPNIVQDGDKEAAKPNVNLQEQMDTLYMQQQRLTSTSDSLVMLFDKQITEMEELSHTQDMDRDKTNELGEMLHSFSQKMDNLISRFDTFSRQLDNRFQALETRVENVELEVDRILSEMCHHGDEWDD